jgi:hypothetical protein
MRQFLCLKGLTSRRRSSQTNQYNKCREFRKLSNRNYALLSGRRGGEISDFEHLRDSTQERRCDAGLEERRKLRGTDGKKGSNVEQPGKI